MFQHLLFVASLIASVAFVRLLGRVGGRQGYLGVLALVMVLLGFGLVRGDRALGFAGMALCTLTVIVPGLLGSLSQMALQRGKTRLAVRLSSLRAVLMPGASLGRQQELMEGMAAVESEGIEAALAHFEALAQGTEDGRELAMIHEQVVATLFHDRRFDEGIAYYERRFQPGYAALRPGLALGLMRAYGESGRLGVAAGLLRALERTALGADARGADLISQAQLTFLAYAGASRVFGEIVAGARHEQVGLSKANAQLLLGIALARAGKSGPAVTALREVESIARPRDARTLQASHASLEDLPDPVQLEPEVATYVQAVSQHIRGALAAAPMMAGGGRPYVTYVVSVALVSMYLTGIVGPRVGLHGAASHWAFGAEHAASLGWIRSLTAPLVSVDLLSLVLTVYAVWLAGHLVERVWGSVRASVVMLGIPALALVLTVLLVPQSIRAGWLVGEATVSTAVCATALWLLTPGRVGVMPQLPDHARKGLTTTMLLLGIANILVLTPEVWRGLATPIPALLCVLLATALVVVSAAIRRPSPPPRAPSGLATAIVVAVVLASAATAAARTAVSAPQADRCLTPFGSEPQGGPSGRSVQVDAQLVPARPADLERHRLPGSPETVLLDRRALRVGAVEAAVLVPPADGSSFASASTVFREFTAVPIAADDPLASVIPPGASGYWLRRGGERVGIVVERPAHDLVAAAVVLPVPKPQALMTRPVALWLLDPGAGEPCEPQDLY